MNWHWNEKSLASQMGVYSDPKGVVSNAEGVDSNTNTPCDQCNTKNTEYYSNNLGLIVEDYETDDNSTVLVSTATMEELSLKNGNAIAIRSDNGCETVCMVICNCGCDFNRVQMNHVVRYNLCVKVWDEVVVIYGQLNVGK